LGAIQYGQTYEVTATVVDAAGNSASDTSMNELRIAYPGPTVNALLTNGDNMVLTGTSGTFGPLLQGQTLTVTVAGASYNVVPDDEGHWSLDLKNTNPSEGTLGVDPEVEGSYSINVNRVGPGNEGTGSILPDGLTTDFTPPAQPTLDYLETNDTTPVITGTTGTDMGLEPGETLQVTVNGATYNVTPNSDGKWSLDLETADPVSGEFVFDGDGYYGVAARVTDAAGNSRQSSHGGVYIDATPPEAPSIHALVNNGSQLLLSGAVYDEVASLTVTVNGATFDVTPNGEDGSWSLNLNEAEPTSGPLGEWVDGQAYDISVVATDSAGNSRTAMLEGGLQIDPKFQLVAQEQSGTALSGQGIEFYVMLAADTVLQLTVTGQDPEQDRLTFNAGESGVVQLNEGGGATLVLSGTQPQLNALMAGQQGAWLQYETAPYTAETAEGRTSGQIDFTLSYEIEGTMYPMDWQSFGIYIVASTTEIRGASDVDPIVMGGLGDDRITAGSYSQNATLYGGSGNDFLYDFWYTEGTQLYGGTGNDALHGHYANNAQLYGGMGDDSLVAGWRNTSMEGGAGNDQFVLSSESARQPAEGAVITDFHRVEGDMDTLVLSNLEDTNADGVIDASDLNVDGLNQIEFSTDAGDLLIRLQTDYTSDFRVQGGATFFNNNSADTLTSLLGSGALVLDQTPRQFWPT
jgi:hypothetical protein